MAIYTKTGDKGETALANGERVSKTDARIEAYGTVDELNSWIGMLRAGIEPSAVSILNPQGVRLFQRSDEQLAWIQNKLFNLGAALSMAPGEWIAEADVKQIEEWIDAMQAEIPKQHAFILPSGCEAAARCHVCRTVCRRAERRMIEIGDREKASEERFSTALRFINRLSDYLFVMARYLNYRQNGREEAWSKD